MVPFHEIAKPREDVRNGAMNKGVYAASLGDLLARGDAGGMYGDADEFNRLTYATRGLKAALDDVKARLHWSEGSGFRQIETGFGGGKTHAMMAMYHKCGDWNAEPIVIDGGRLNASKQTIWGEIERQIFGNIERMSGMVAPSEDDIHRLLRVFGKPVLILMDEILPYVDSAAGQPVGDSNMAVQTNIFIQRLSNAVKSLPNVCVVLSLPDRGSAHEVKLYDRLRNIAGRQKQVVTVASDSDIPHIIRRRLFETDEDIIADRASDTIQSYVDACVKGRSIPPDGAESYAERFRATYPFTPDVIDVLYRRWGSYHKFQRTRGALRLLSSVVHSLLDTDRPYITLSDIDLNVDDIRRELVQYAGDNVEAVISEDITDEMSNSVVLGSMAVRAARAIFMHSFPAEGGGATMDDVKRAAFTAYEGHCVVGDVLAKMRRSLFYLYITDDDTFRFTHDENINRTISRAMHGVNDMDEEERAILERGAGKKFRRVYAWPEHYTRIEDADGLQLVILKDADLEYCKDVVANVSKKSRRVNQNMLVFVLPSGNGLLTESIRKLLAVRRVRSVRTDLKPAAARVLDGAEKDARDGIAVGIREKYTEIWLPDKTNGVRQIGVKLSHPEEDSRPFGDTIWDKLVEELQIAERLDPGLVGEYGSDAEAVFNRMVRTCGEHRPVSRDVVRNALERLKDAEQQESAESGSTARHEPERPAHEHAGACGEPCGEQIESPEPEPAAPPVAGIHYTDVVNRNPVVWLGSIFATLHDKPTTTVRVAVDQKGADEFSVHLDMTGKIPRTVADIIHRRTSKKGTYSEDEAW